MGSRFFLIFFLARFLEPAQLGLYGLVVATIGYSLYLLGFDFYTYTTREILKRERSEWGGLLKDQGALTLTLCAIFLPILSLIFFKELLPWNISGWFFVILILEHLNQELGRLLVAISEPLLASVMHFLRQGTWAIAVVALMEISPTTRSIDFVLGAWALAGLLSVVAGFYTLVQLHIVGWQKKTDWNWISKGLKVSIPFLLGTLAIRGVFTIDRFWLESLGGLEVVGAYVLFIGICGSLMSFLDAGLFTFAYPSLISAYHKKQHFLFSKAVRTLLLQTAALSAVFSVVSLLVLSPLLSWLNNPLYVEKQYLFPWTLATIVLFALGMVPHYALYAQGLDRPIINSHIGSLLTFIIATWLFSQNWPLLAVPLGLCTAFAVILIWKTWAFIKLTPSQYQFAQV